MTLVRWITTVGCCMVLGCASRPAGGDVSPTAILLEDVNYLLHRAMKPNGDAAARLADLEPGRAMYPRGYEAVKSGEVVVLWGTPMQSEEEAGKDTAVVAYEKNVPTEGGYVLMSAGTVKKMTAEEFAAAPKVRK
jgi:hypothetical protein